jgi:hypothetical protein
MDAKANSAREYYHICYSSEKHMNYTNIDGRIHDLSIFEKFVKSLVNPIHLYLLSYQSVYAM